MPIKMTVSGNIETKKGWSGLRKHMEHSDQLNHKNKYLNSQESKNLRKYNKHIKLIDFDDFCQKEFKDFVKSHDEHHSKKEQYKSVKQFIKFTDKGKLRPQPIDKEYLSKLGDKNSYRTYMNELVQTIEKYKKVNKEQAYDMALKTTVHGFEHYINGFNQRNPNLKMFEAYIHADEEGAMHVHSRVLPFVNTQQKTKTGQLKKPSFSLNTALSHQFGIARNGKKALTLFRNIEDQKLLDSLNEVTRSELHLVPNFVLDRKKDHDPAIKTGLRHDEYVRIQHEKDIQTLQKEETQINQNKLTIGTQTQKINKNSQIINDQNEQVKSNKNVLENQNQQIINNQQVINNQQEQLLNAQKIIKKAKKIKKKINAIYETFYGWIAHTLTKQPANQITPQNIENTEKEFSNIEKTNFGRLAIKNAFSLVCDLIPGLTKLGKDISSINLEDTPHVQKSPSETIENDKRINKPKSQKDDEIEF